MTHSRPITQADKTRAVMAALRAGHIRITPGQARAIVAGRSPKESHMERRTIALVLFALASACFLVVLASVIGSDFQVQEPAWLAAGFLLLGLGFVTERLR